MAIVPGAGVATAESTFRELSDAELAQLRGRYAPRGDVGVFFGIRMESQWLTREGASYRGGLSFSLDMSGPVPQPQFTVYRSVTAGSQADEPSGDVAVSGTGGLGQAAGVVQSNQVAGTGNTAMNSAGLHISSDPDDAAGFGTAPAATTAAAGQGSGAVTVIAGSGRLGLQITTPQGTARQGLFGPQLTQSIAIAGDFNRVSHHLQMVLVNDGLRFAQDLPLRHAVRDALLVR